LTRVAAVFGAEAPTPARVTETVTPAPAVTSGTATQAGAVTDAPEMAPSPPVKKRRGFWSRVFGIGKHSDDEKSDAGTKARKRKPDR
jgi:hypothetical protein